MKPKFRRENYFGYKLPPPAIWRPRLIGARFFIPQNNQAKEGFFGLRKQLRRRRRGFFRIGGEGGSRPRRGRGGKVEGSLVFVSIKVILLLLSLKFMFKIEVSFYICCTFVRIEVVYFSIFYIYFTHNVSY